MSTLAACTLLACAACGSHSGTEHSTYFHMDLCRRCWNEAKDRLGLTDHPTLNIDGLAIQQGLEI